MTLGVDEDLSIGDFVLSGGELPALVVLDAVARLLPGVLADERSSARGLLSARGCLIGRTTRAEGIRGLGPCRKCYCPGITQISGAGGSSRPVGRTWLRRPDLIVKRS